MPEAGCRMGQGGGFTAEGAENAEADGVLLLLLRAASMSQCLLGGLSSMPDAGSGGFASLLGFVQVPDGLQVHPQFGGGLQRTGKVERRVRSNASLAPDQFIQFGRCPPDSGRKSPLGNTHGEKKLLQKHFPGMDGILRSHDHL